LTPEQVIALVSAVLTGALGAFVTVTIKFLGFIRDERLRSEAQAEKFSSAMSVQGKEMRELVYRIVEQRDRDIERVTTVVQGNAHELSRVAHVCERLEHFLIQYNGAA
jgi:hypothetical protein